MAYFSLKKNCDWYNRILEGRQAGWRNSIPFKLTPVKKPTVKGEPDATEPVVIDAEFIIGDRITMDDVEGYVLEGGLPEEKVYSEEPPAVDVKGEEDGTIIGAWSAVALQARRCRTTKKGGPDWNDVVMRITRDAESGEEIERLEDASAILSKALLYKPVPGAPRDIITELYYRSTPKKKIEAKKVDPADLEADENSPYGYYVDTLGRRYKEDQYGMIIRKTTRPPHIPVEMRVKANHRQRQKLIAA